MYKNYETRVKDFIIDMNSADTKIEIKDYEKRINNPKTDLLVEKDIQKPFVFKGYTTEADRIKDSVKRNRYLYNLPDYDEMLDKTPNKRIVNRKVSSNNVNNIRKINSSFDDRLRNNSSSNELNNHINNNKKTRNISGLSLSEIKKYKYILKNALIMQPEMRFKPRTDLERIYDIVNGYKYGQIKKEILDKQLEKLDLFRYKNKHELYKLLKQKIKEKNMNNSYEKLSSSNDDIDESNKKNNIFFNSKDIDYKSKPWIKREDLNIDALKLLNSYHYKTHFKAAKEVASNKRKIFENIDCEENNNINSNNLKKRKIKNEKKSCLLLPNLFRSKRHIISKSSTEGNNLLDNLYNKDNKRQDIIDIKLEKNDNNLFNFELDNLKEINEEEKDNFNNIYDKNKNPFKKNIVYDENKIKILNDIAFLKNDDEETIKEDNNNHEENNKNNYIEENNIIVGNEKLDKNKQFDIITNKILGNCNVLKHKSKFNDTTLKKRNGKLMITHGLSINQFEKKYGFK